MIELACTTDGAYAPHTGTMLHSALAASRGHACRVHILHGDLSDEDRSRLRTVGRAFDAAVEFLAVTAEQAAPFPAHRFHRSCWYRVLLPELLPALDRILYLDSDMIVRKGLGSLWNTDVTGRPFAGVVNPFYPFFPDYHVSHLGLAPGSPYYNSGVLLMNLDWLRRDGFGERVRAYAAAHPDNLFPEQDALNALYQHDALPLDPRWNAQSTVFELRTTELPFTARQVAEARSDPAIVHFIGPYKPWTYVCSHPLRGLYHEHRRQTPWPPEPLIGRSFRAWLLRALPVDLRYRWGQAELAVRNRLRRLRGVLRGAS